MNTAIIMSLIFYSLVPSKPLYLRGIFELIYTQCVALIQRLMLVLLLQVGFQYFGAYIQEFASLNRPLFQHMNDYLVTETNTHDSSKKGVWVFKLNTEAGDAVLQPPLRGSPLISILCKLYPCIVYQLSTLYFKKLQNRVAYQSQ